MTTQTSASETQRPVEQQVSTPGGRIFVTDMPGEDPPFVLMHGYPDDHRIYTALTPLLAPRRTVAFDFAGYGRSERNEEARFSAEDHGAQITAVLDALGIDRAVLVGHDASGPDAVSYAIAHPDRVEHLVLLNTIFGHRPALHMPEMTRLYSEPELKTLADDMTADPNQLLWLLVRWGQQLGLDDGVVQQSILAQFVGNDQQPSALESVRAWTAALPESLDRQEAIVASGALGRLAVPVTIVWGDADRYLTPALATEIAALFPDPAVHFVAGAGHYVQHDRPGEVAELLKRA
jgi:pimeloyl-ACP methyl ester carboxylesterase